MGHTHLPESFDQVAADCCQRRNLLLRAAIRRQLLELINDSQLRLHDANEALTAWQLAPLPGLWHVYLRLDCARSTQQVDATHAIDEVAARLRQQYADLCGADNVLAVTIVEAAVVDRADATLFGYQITAQVLCLIAIKASCEAGAIQAARTQIAHLIAEAKTCPGDQVAQAWISEDHEIATAPLDPDTDAPYWAAPTPGQPAGAAASDWLAWEKADLARLRRDIRDWVIDSLQHATLFPSPSSDDPDGTFQRAQTLLATLDLPPLAVARHYQVAVRWHLTITAATDTQARAHTRHVYGDSSPVGRSRLLPLTWDPTADQSPPQVQPTGSDGWTASLHRVFRVCLRPDGHPAVARAVVRTHLETVAGTATADYTVIDLGVHTDWLLDTDR